MLVKISFVTPNDKLNLYKLPRITPQKSYDIASKKLKCYIPDNLRIVINDDQLIRSYNGIGPHTSNRYTIIVSMDKLISDIKNDIDIDEYYGINVCVPENFLQQFIFTDGAYTNTPDEIYKSQSVSYKATYTINFRIDENALYDYWKNLDFITYIPFDPRMKLATLYAFTNGTEKELTDEMFLLNEHTRPDLVLGRLDDQILFLNGTQGNSYIKLSKLESTINQALVDQLEDEGKYPLNPYCFYCTDDHRIWVLRNSGNPNEVNDPYSPLSYMQELGFVDEQNNLYETTAHITGGSECDRILYDQRMLSNIFITYIEDVYPISISCNLCNTDQELEFWPTVLQFEKNPGLPEYSLSYIQALDLNEFHIEPIQDTQALMNLMFDMGTECYS